MDNRILIAMENNKRKRKILNIISLLFALLVFTGIVLLIFELKKIGLLFLLIGLLGTFITIILLITQRGSDSIVMKQLFQYGNTPEANACYVKIKVGKYNSWINIALYFIIIILLVTSNLFLKISFDSEKGSWSSLLFFFLTIAQIYLVSAPTVLFFIGLKKRYKTTKISLNEDYKRVEKKRYKLVLSSFFIFLGLTLVINLLGIINSNDNVKVYDNSIVYDTREEFTNLFFEYQVRDKALVDVGLQKYKIYHLNYNGYLYRSGLHDGALELGNGFIYLNKVPVYRVDVQIQKEYEFGNNETDVSTVVEDAYDILCDAFINSNSNQDVTLKLYSGTELVIPRNLFYYSQTFDYYDNYYFVWMQTGTYKLDDGYSIKVNGIYTAKKNYCGLYYRVNEGDCFNAWIECPTDIKEYKVYYEKNKSYNLPNLSNVNKIEEHTHKDEFLGETTTSVCEYGYIRYGENKGKYGYIEYGYYAITKNIPNIVSIIHISLLLLELSIGIIIWKKQEKKLLEKK